MPSVKVVQLPHQLKKDGTCQILIRITEGKKSRYVKTGYHVKPTQFKEGHEGWVVKHPDALLINAAIESKRAGIMENIITADIEGVKVDIDNVAGKKPTGTKTIFGVITNLIQSYEHKNQVAAYNRLITNLRYLKDAWQQDILVKDLNRQWVDKFINYRYKKGNSASTIKKNLADLSVALKAIDYTGVDYFMKGAKSMKAQPVQRDKLTAEEVKLLENIKLTGLPDLARDMFLFSFYCHGMRFESVALFDIKSIQGKTITYRMNKGKKIREIEIHAKLKAIIEKYKNDGSLYLFPVVKKEVDTWNKKEIVGSGNSLINNYLGRVAILAGIEKHISFHMARHTFATIGLNKGLSYAVLKEALGHTKYSTTEGYLKSLSDDTVNKAVRKMWD